MIFLQCVLRFLGYIASIVRKENLIFFFFLSFSSSSFYSCLWFLSMGFQKSGTFLFCQYNVDERNNNALVQNLWLIKYILVPIGSNNNDVAPIIHVAWVAVMWMRLLCICCKRLQWSSMGGYFGISWQWKNAKCHCLVSSSWNPSWHPIIVPILNGFFFRAATPACT